MKVNGWHGFGVNAALGAAAAVDQLTGAGVLQSMGPWGAIGALVLNILAHAVVATKAPAANDLTAVR